MHLKGVCWEVDWLFPIWKTFMTGRKRKRRKLIGLLQFSWVDFLRGESFWILSYPVLLQPESNLRCPQVRVQIPRQAEAWQPAGDRIPKQVEVWWPPKNWVPGQVKVWMTSWDPWTGRSPSRLRCDNLSMTRSLDRSRQVDLLGPRDWSWASPRSPPWPVLGRIKGL